MTLVPDPQVLDEKGDRLIELLKRESALEQAIRMAKDPKAKLRLLRQQRSMLKMIASDTFAINIYFFPVVTPN